MRSNAIGRTILLFLILMGTQAAQGSSDRDSLWIEVYGGFDESWNYWLLTDENLAPLEDGDSVMVIWTGPDGVIDPPVRAVGSPFNGQPSGDDLELSGGIIEYGTFYIRMTTWEIGDADSLGRQRHPTAGDLIYARVFNDADLVNATYYGDSEPHEVIYMFQEPWFCVLPNDPVGPTTDAGIFGRFFKIIGGIDPNTGQTFPLRDSDDILEDGDVVQLIWTGPDGEIDSPDLIDRMPGDDDEFIESWGINEGMWPAINTGVFRRSTASFDHPAHGLPAQEQGIYVRVFNADNILAADCYGDSPIYTVTYEIGESLSVFYDDSIDCLGDTNDHPRDCTIYGGTNPVDMSPWPLVDADGLQLHDGDLVQLIWAGTDALVDELDESTGSPTGDDSLLATWGVGNDIIGTETGRFKYWLFTYRNHDKGGYPAEGDAIYLRVFNDSITVEAPYYGESETHVVAYEYDEEFFAFPDSALDAVIPNPSCTTSAEERATPEVSPPTEYALYQNRPNPFNADTEIRYAIPEDELVTLKIYNILGAEVAALVDVQQPAGVYTLSWNAGDLASGVYFGRLIAGDFSKTVKMVHLK